MEFRDRSSAARGKERRRGERGWREKEGGKTRSIASVAVMIRYLSATTNACSHAFDDRYKVASNSKRYRETECKPHLLVRPAPCTLHPARTLHPYTPAASTGKLTVVPSSCAGSEGWEETRQRTPPIVRHDGHSLASVSSRLNSTRASRVALHAGFLLCGRSEVLLFITGGLEEEVGFPRYIPPEMYGLLI
jgi:hypothetical protein